MKKLFISYSRKDIEFAKKLAGDLEKAGYDVWWDITDLQGGDDWVKKLPAAIEAADYFIILLTPNSTISEWVQKEYTQALGLRKKIVPIMLETCPVPFALNTINFINFIVGEYPDNFKKLLSALGYEGNPPVVTPFERATTILPPPMRKYALPAVAVLVLFVIATLVFFPRNTEPVEVTPSATHTEMPTFVPVVSDTPTSTVTQTPTQTPTVALPSATPTSTNPPFEALTFCVNSLYANTINVRSGPGTNYAVIGEPLPLRRCLEFRGVNENVTWLLIATNQEDPRNTQYEGGWIFRELLGLGLSGPIDLPAVTLTPTSTPSSTPTPSNTPTITPSLTLTPTDIDTPTPTDSPTDTPEPSSTPTP